MWHYVDIHDRLISLTSSLYSQMDALLEPFSNQPPAPAKLAFFFFFYNFKCFILGKQIAKLDWNQSTYWRFALLAEVNRLFFSQLIEQKPIV